MRERKEGKNGKEGRGRLTNKSGREVRASWLGPIFLSNDSLYMYNHFFPCRPHFQKVFLGFLRHNHNLMVFCLHASQNQFNLFRMPPTTLSF